MKKGLLFALIGLVAIAGFSAYQGRTLSQQTFDQQLVELKKVAPLYRLSVEEATLKHQLFSGQAKVSLFFTPPDDKIPPMFFVMESDIQYGPLLFSDNGIALGLAGGQTRLSVTGLPEDVSAKLEALIGPHLMTADTRVDFAKVMHAEIQTPAIDFSDAQGRFMFDGIQAAYQHDLNSQQIDGSLEIGELTLNTPKLDLKLLAGHGDYQFTRVTELLSPGKFKLLFPELIVSSPDADFNIRGVGLDVEQRLENNQLSVSETLRVDDIVAPIPVTAASATFDFNNINPASIERWSELVTTYGADPEAIELSPPSEQQMRELITLFLQKGVQFNQYYDVDAFGGNVLADLDIEYQGLEDGTHPLDVDNPQRLIAAVDAQLMIEADQQLINATPVAPMVPQYIDQGLIIQQDNKLKLEANLSAGQLVVNGQPFPLEALF